MKENVFHAIFEKPLFQDSTISSGKSSLEV